MGGKRTELDEVADYMRGIQETTEDIRTSLEKRQKAKTRLRNEIGAVTAELRRTVDEHEQEKEQLEIIKTELESETEIKLKEKNQLELEFKKLQHELEKHVTLVEANLDDLETRYSGKTEEIKKTNSNIEHVSGILNKITEDYSERKRKLAERRQSVKEFTENNLKNTRNFDQGIKQLSTDEVELTEERDNITEPYKILIQEHSDETSTYNSLKADVLALNAKLRAANEEISEYNKNIADMQEPRRKLKEVIYEKREAMENENQDSFQKVYKIERRTYELLRKLEEYKRRNDEIQECAYAELDSSVYQGQLLKKVENSHGDGLVRLDDNLGSMEGKKTEIYKIVDDLVKNGEVFKDDLGRYEAQVEAKLKTLGVIGEGFKESVDRTQFK